MVFSYINNTFKCYMLLYYIYVLRFINNYYDIYNFKIKRYYISVWNSFT